jgi:hypothetical protein
LPSDEQVRLGPTHAAKQAACNFLESAGLRCGGYESAKMVHDGVVAALVRYYLDSSTDLSHREAAMRAFMGFCMSADGHGDEDEPTPAMHVLGVSDPDYAVRLALAAGCPRKLFQELAFVHQMMVDAGEILSDAEDDEDDEFVDAEAPTSGDEFSSAAPAVDSL